MYSLLQAVVNDARFEPQALGIGIESNLAEVQHEAEALPTVKGNAELIRRALGNVLRNALRHSERGQSLLGERLRGIGRRASS